jgi:hypothetical protein
MAITNRLSELEATGFSTSTTYTVHMQRESHLANARPIVRAFDCDTLEEADALVADYASAGGWTPTILAITRTVRVVPLAKDRVGGAFTPQEGGT